jgi:MoaA/NifB/PqqE/SkfB family radical SAM enzyme
MDPQALPRLPSQSGVPPLKKRRVIDNYMKALRRTARYHAREVLGLRVKPRKLRISLTNRCNSRCIMCSIWQFQDNNAPSLPGEITPDEISHLAAVNRGFFSDVSHVSITGGEPTLRRDFVEVMKNLAEGFPDRSLSFNTNAFATKKIVGLAESCFDYMKELTVMISLDGMGEAHDTVRGMRNVFAPVIKTIEGLRALRSRKRKIKVEINTVMTNENSDQLRAIYDFCAQNDISFNPISITIGQLYQNQATDDSTMRLSDDSRANLLRDLREIAKTDRSLIIGETIRILETQQRDFDCWAGRLIFLIEENCDVFPNGGCPTDFKLGNLRDYDFDMLRLLEAHDAREVLRKARSCRRCQIPCEYMSTLRHAEALSGFRKARGNLAALEAGAE